MIKVLIVNTKKTKKHNITVTGFRAKYRIVTSTMSKNYNALLHCLIINIMLNNNFEPTFPK